MICCYCSSQFFCLHDLLPVSNSYTINLLPCLRINSEDNIFYIFFCFIISSLKPVRCRKFAGHILYLKTFCDLTVGCDEEVICTQGYTCINGYCYQQCTTQDDCSFNTVCTEDSCLLACKNDDQCLGYQKCHLNGYCITTISDIPGMEKGLINILLFN